MLWIHASSVPARGLLGALALTLLSSAAVAAVAPSGVPAPPQQAPSLTAHPDDIVEGVFGAVLLSADYVGIPSTHAWTQIAGPRVPLTDLGPKRAVADVVGLEVAVDVELVFQLEVSLAGAPQSGSVAVRVRPKDMLPVLGPNVQIGGATTAIATIEHEGEPWALYNVGGRLDATRIGMTPAPIHSIQLLGFVKDALVVQQGEQRFGLFACGGEGIAIVDVTDPTAMQWLGNVRVNYHQDGLTWTEGGGAILVDQVLSGVGGDVAALETDGTTLWIANASYGVQRTALANLLGSGGPMLEPDGTLLVDHERYTLLFAGEQAWGAPLGMRLDSDRLFVAHQYLGLSIYEPESLEPVGRYNLYTDVTAHEDWFLDMDVANEVQPGFLDAVTGMPDYRQASYEIENSHGAGSGGEDFATPWADFDKYGKYYYQAQDVTVAHFPQRTVAYIAYGLGGLVAVDVTGFEQADASENFLVPQYLGFVPGVPAHGSDEFIGEHSDSIFPHFGAGMLKEAGVIDVEVVGSNAYYTDHFAGLVVLGGANNPAAYWHGRAAPYDNDNGIPGDHNPDYEFVTSFDMSPYDPEDHESLPAWMYQRLCRIVTGEIGGHGNSLALMSDLAPTQAGQVDVVLCLGAGGLDFVDIKSFTAKLPQDRFDVVAYFPTTDEVGAAPDGSPTQSIAIGHSQGVDASDEYLYVADGPHGVSAWSLLDEQGYPTDDVHLVANTVQDEYPVTVGDTTVYPATHAYGVVFDPLSRSAMALCQGVGLRRLPVADVEDGLAQVGNPLLIAPQPEDIFEHNGAYGKVHSVPKQDHTYDVALDNDLAFVADGGNGLTIYDLTKDPTDIESGFFVSNLGGATKERPLLGRSTGIALWRDLPNGKHYAFLAAGPYGVGVADVTDVAHPELLKTFEPVKLEDGKVGKADGRCVDVFVMEPYAYFTYDGFGVLSYRLDDLIEPLPAGVPATKIWKVQAGVVQYDYRPLTVGEFRLREEPGYEDLGGGALNMSHTEVAGEPVLYVAYGVAGVVKLVWTDPAAPLLDKVLPTVGECSAIALSNGRLYAADGGGGLIFFK